MVFWAKDIRIIRVGNGQGLILPKESLRRNDVEAGDLILIEIKEINRREREDFQRRKGLKWDMRGNLIKTKR